MTNSANKIAAVNQYILNSADFAHPILEHLRALVHFACPEIEETIKWGFPNFTYKNKNLCSMAAFKAHCAFTFWNADVLEHQGLLRRSEKAAMGHLGKMTSLEDIPDEDFMIELIRASKADIDAGVKIVKKQTTQKEDIQVPPEFEAALRTNVNMAKHFNAFSPSKKKDYLLWFAEAKTETTLNKRIQTAIEWISEGKTRNWKYEK